MVWKIWEHKGWGDAINWTDWDERTIHGHLTPSPKIGDEVQAKMQSGKIGRFEIIEIRYMSDPKDMFFATVKDLGYVE